MSIIIFILVLSVLIIVHEFGHFITAKKMGVKVERFSVGFGPRLFTKNFEGTQYTICVFPLGGFVKLAGDSYDDSKGAPDEYLSQPLGKRFKILFFGSFLNYVVGFLCFWLIFFAGYPRLTPTVGDLKEGYGAEIAGLKTGDRIISVDGKKIVFWDELQEYIQDKKAGEKALISVIRDQQEHVFDVEVKEDIVENILSEKYKVGLIGISPSGHTQESRHSLVEAFILGARRTQQLTVLTYKAIWRMLSGKMSFRNSVTGPLGIFDVTAKAARTGVTAVINVMAILSISLAIFNLLPIPALDGGHIFLLFIEKIRGKNFSKKFETTFSQIGFVVLITLAVVVFYNDLVRLGFFDKLHKWFVK